VARLREKHLPHRISLQTLAEETAEGGGGYGTPVPDVPAYVEQKTRLRVDRRSMSETAGQEITSTTMVIVLPQHDVPPRTRVTVWEATGRERTSEVIDSACFDYRGTPNHIELYLE
jgi:hypothetical protein